MGNLMSGGCGCASEPDDFEGFRDTGGAINIFMVTLDYNYSEGNELTASCDGDNFSKMIESAKAAGANIGTVGKMRDDEVNMGTNKFPTKENVGQQMREVAANCRAGDWFIFFYAGHGMTIQDRPPLDEDDGMDEAFATPGPRGALEEDCFFVDDDFADQLDKYTPEGVKILVICDCCHSATVCDVDTRKWDHAIVSISACQDFEESADTGSGGLLTYSIKNALSQLGRSMGNKEYSIQRVYDRVQKEGLKISTEQATSMQFTNIDPAKVAWPLSHGFFG